jgi:lysozyme family protein
MMQNNFERSLALVLQHEGGYVNHPSDPGGRTNLGVTQRVWEEYVGHPVDEQAMRSLTKEMVAPLYKKNYWDVVCGDVLPAGCDYLLFDFAVNAGASRAIKTAQKSLGINADGALGPITTQALLTAKDFIEKFSMAKESFYRSLTTFPTFGKGWLNRVAESKKNAEGMLS